MFPIAPPFSLDFPRAHGTLAIAATFRTVPEDFRVDEQLGFDLCGDGEHAYLHVRKRGHNTQWLAQQLAQFAAVTVRDVGYCGLKDRHAVTSQWFSIYDPKRRDIDWSRFQQEGTEVLRVGRHSHKLKLGSHQGNHFDIVLRDVRLLRFEANDLSQRLLRVSQGVPNYFGEQRFGRGGHNLQLAYDWFCNGVDVRKNKLRGLTLSAARAYLFNVVLAARVSDGSWASRAVGDVEQQSEATGPLWGRGRPPVSGATLALEQAALEPWSAWCERLEHVGLQQQRRPLALVPTEFKSQIQPDSLRLTFTLQPGQFATAVLREIALLTNGRTGA